MSYESDIILLNISGDQPVFANGDEASSKLLTMPYIRYSSGLLLSQTKAFIAYGYDNIGGGILLDVSGAQPALLNDTETDSKLEYETAGCYTPSAVFLNTSKTFIAYEGNDEMGFGILLDVSGNQPTYIGNTHDTATSTDNHLDIFDMSGNVWEWQWDWYNSYSSEAQADPKGEESGTYRVIRGGSWTSGPELLQTSYRSKSLAPDKTENDVGFRTVRKH